MGEWGGGRRERKAWHKTIQQNRVTHPKSGCGRDWITHNTPWRHRPQVNTSTAIGKEKPLKFFIDVLISYGRREEFTKVLEGAFKFFPGIKIKPEQELCFQSLVVKRKDVLGVWKSLIYQLLPKLCPSIGFTRPGQRRRYQCFRYLSSDLQHPAVKRVLLL